MLWCATNTFFVEVTYMKNNNKFTGCFFIFFALFLFNFSFVFSQVQFIDSESKVNWGLIDFATVELVGNSSLNIVHDEDFRIDDLNIEISSFPKKSRQVNILKLDFFPDDNVVSFDDSHLDELEIVNFLFDNPKFSNLKYGFNSKLNLIFDPLKIDSKVSYPIVVNKIDSRYWKYLRSANYIDSDNFEIQKKAKEIIGNSDDLFEISYLLAKWVNENVDYVLEGNSDVVKKASWVLENRQGVCDEFGGLYIAFLRSLGIPARYVSGIAYTNSELFDRNWELHGWAQVYFPDYGWVDFDPTYGQYGFVDISHIPFKFSVDSGEPSTKYSMRSYGANLDTKQLEHTVNLLDYKEDMVDDIDVELYAHSSEIGEGYGYLILNIRNTNPFYQVFTLRSGKLRGTELSVNLEEELKTVLLEPNEEKVIYWKYDVVKGETYNPKYQYEIPFVFSTNKNKTYETKITLANNYRSYSEEVIDDILKNLRFEQDSEIKNKINLNCYTDKKEYLIYENLNLNCEYEIFDNILKQNILSKKNYQFCVEGVDICKNLELSNLNGLNKISFDILNLSFFVDTGILGVSIYDEFGEILISKFLPVYVSDAPEVNFVNLNYPEKIKFQSGFEISFDLESNVNQELEGELFLFYGGRNNSWDVNVNSLKPFKIQLDSRYFLDEKSNITLIYEYQDLNGNNYFSKKYFFIELYDLKFFDKVHLFLNKLNNQLDLFLSRFI